MSTNKTTKIMIYKPDAVIEGWYTKGASTMCALLLPPHPLLGGNISNTLLRLINQVFVDKGFNTLRVNYRGIGLSKGDFNERSMDLQDALDALDWLSVQHSDPRILWVGGFGYGAHQTINLAMRRPGVHGFVSITPYASDFDFNILTPCPNGLIVSGSADRIVDCDYVRKIANELSNQKGCSIVFEDIQGADHNYVNHRIKLYNSISAYLSKVLGFEVNQQTRSAMLA